MMTRRPRLPAGCVTALCAAVLGCAVWMLREPGWAALRDHPYFAITDLVIRGCGPRLNDEAIRDWLGVRDGASLWDASPIHMRARLEAHPLIARATVRREFPGRFEITVQERRPEAIAVLDDLYYLDRTGKVFGPLTAEHDRDYPMITGLGGDAPAGSRASALRRALRLVRLCARRGCFEGVSEINVHPQLGVVLYPTRPAVPIVLGWGSWREKIQRAKRVAEAWHGALDRVASIDARFRGQVVVRARAPGGAARRVAPAPAMRI